MQSAQHLLGFNLLFKFGFPLKTYTRTYPATIENVMDCSIFHRRI